MTSNIKNNDKMQDNRLIEQIQLQNILSFGNDVTKLKLKNLNLLIGPNGSGKSNLIKIIALMRATPTDILSAIRKSGGSTDLKWMGSDDEEMFVSISIPQTAESEIISHHLRFITDSTGIELNDEHVLSSLQRERFIYHNNEVGKGRNANSVLPKFNKNASILSQISDPQRYPEFHYLKTAYENIRIFRNGTYGSNSNLRQPQHGDLRDDRLEEDYSNLGLILNRFQANLPAKIKLIAGLKDFCPEFTDYYINIKGGMVEIFFYEGDWTMPARRLSDGTLNYLCLLAILCDPDPPPLICLEEPELGLQPDILHKLADHIKDASKRTQLIITTHSEILVDEFTDMPESVVVFDKEDGMTKMKRLEKESLEKWLEKYRLGQLWLDGEIGGTRW